MSNNDTEQDNKNSTLKNDEIVEQKDAEKETEFKKIIKEGSGLSILKIAATALTAVSMALLSANLTGIVNSLMLVAIVSIGTAIVSEFYRVILSVTSLGAKKVVAPVLQTTVIKDKDGKTTTITSETPILDENDLKNVKKDAKEQESMKSLEEKVSETGNGKLLLIFSKIRYKFTRYFRNNPFMRFILLFAGIAILTISTSYFVSEGNNNTDSIFTTVYKTEEQKQSLSEKEKQEIIDEAVAQSKESAPSTTVVEKETEVRVEDDKNQVENQNNSESQTNSPENTSTDKNNTSETDTTKPSTSNNQNNNSNTNDNEKVSPDDIQKLLDRIEQLEKDNTTLKTELENIQKEPTDDTTNNNVTEEELQEKINELQEQIDELNNNASTSNNSATSSTSIPPNSTTTN